MTVFSDFLKVLKVPHTEEFSDAQFRGMSFKSLFGFSRLLNSYGIASETIQLADKSKMADIPTPFLAQEGSFFVIVTSISKNEDGTGTVELLHFGNPEKWTIEQLIQKSTGIVLLAHTDSDSKEPDYGQHHLHELAMKAKSKVLILASAFVLICGFIVSGLWHNLSTILLSLVDLAGLVITWFLILKSLHVSSSKADAICGVLEKHGCDRVLEQKASTFFGLFSWSEVGIAYFIVSTLVLFIFPDEIRWLAVLNAMALPFTVWSIWYQKFKIKTWCTLCVTTQTLLWLQFFCFLFGGWWSDIFPLRLPLFMIGAAFIGLMLAINAIMTFVKKKSGIAPIA